MKQMVDTMQNADHRTKVEDALKGMKDDPELKSILEELETGGPMAMMKWVVLQWQQLQLQQQELTIVNAWVALGCASGDGASDSCALPCTCKCTQALNSLHPSLHRYWNDPEVLSKLGKAMGGAFQLPGAEGEEEEAEEEEGEPTVLSTASAGDYGTH